jgi:hypothetical protein
MSIDTAHAAQSMGTPKARPLFERALVAAALRDALRKLSPAHML